MLAYWISIFRVRRLGRWARRTRWMLGRMAADFGFGGASRPVWLRDNPFLLKAGRAEARRAGLPWRLAATVGLLGGLLLGGLWLGGRMGPVLRFILLGLLRVPPAQAVFAATAFVHVLLVVGTRTAGATPLADEARRATLPDLLMTPLRRAEMLLAMGAGPARAALTVALAGLPVYLLLGQLGGVTGWQTACLYVVFGLLCYQPPGYAVPALAGAGQTPDAVPGQFASAASRRPLRGTSFVGAGFPVLLGLQIAGQVFGTAGGVWLGHLGASLHLPLRSAFSFLVYLTWPYFASRLLADTLPFFHASLSPLVYVLPIAVMQWAGSALGTAAALSAGSEGELKTLPLGSRARTVQRATARVIGFCILAVAWRAWVDSGDTAGLAGVFASGPAWSAAGLLTLLGGLALPGVCSRALGVEPRAPLLSGQPRPAGLVLRRTVKRGLRPLGVAFLMFLLACACGGVSPFAAPVFLAAGRIALAGLCTLIWAAGVRRALSPWSATSFLAAAGLLYALPAAALSLPGGGMLAALSPVSAWVSIFAGGPALVSRFPVWPLSPLPPFWVCVLGPLLLGAVLMTIFGRRVSAQAAGTRAAIPKPRGPARSEAQTAALLGWITARTDNPLFTYEMRTRTRSGRWLDRLILGTVGFAGLIVVVRVYPWVLGGFSEIVPHFFPDTEVWASLAALLLTAQCLLLGLQGQTVGERLIAKDREQGTWGFLLISPLSMRAIFWGKVFGQSAAVGAAWAGAGLACLVLYGASAPSVGVWPALGAWAAGQIFVAALFMLGLGLGTALAAWPAVQKTLKGLSTLLFVVIVGGAVYAEYQLLLLDAVSGWSSLAGLLAENSAAALILAAALFWVGERRLAALRGRDTAAGDGTG